MVHVAAQVQLRLFPRRVPAGAVEGPVTSMITASAIQLHPNTTVVVDEDSAGELQMKDYYKWCYENRFEG